MIHTESFTVTWTDGGRPSNSGYFDGAGSMNEILLCIFAGKDAWEREGSPVGCDIMEMVKYGTKLKVTISIEDIK